MATFSELTTPGGYMVGEVASAMQKAIRRGEEREAVFWASELDLQGLGNYAWKRLRIIASEDVGVADSSVTVTVWALYQDWLELKRNAKPGYEGFYRVKLFHAVVLLARAPKSRILDHLLMIMHGQPEAERRAAMGMEIPDHALDQHTKRGKRKGRGMKHFLEVGSKLENNELIDPYAEEARAVMLRTEPPVQTVIETED